MKKLFENFEQLSSRAQGLLEQGIQQIRDGFAPDDVLCNEITAALTSLRSAYENIRNTLSEHILAGEIPDGDLSVHEFEEAWKNSVLGRQKAVRDVLDEFIRVYSDEQRYMDAITPYIEEAKNILAGVDNAPEWAIAPDVSAFQLFLEGLKEDLEADTELADRIIDSLGFSPRVVKGLFDDKYHIRSIAGEEETPKQKHDSETTANDNSITAETSIAAEQIDVNTDVGINSDEHIQEDSSAVETEEATKSVKDEPHKEYAEALANTEDGDTEISDTTVEDGNDGDVPQTEAFVYAINTPTVPSKLPSDQKFKEIVNNAGVALHVLIDNLPFSGIEEIGRLYTMLGADNGPQYRKRCDTMIPYLEGKGFIYRYNFENRVFVCFTEYAKKCFEKKSLAEYFKRRYKLRSIGKHHFIGTPEVPIDKFAYLVKEYDIVMKIFDLSAEDDRLRHVFPSFSWKEPEQYFVANMKTGEKEEMHLRAVDSTDLSEIEPKEQEGMLCYASAFPNMDGVTDDVRYCLMENGLYQYKGSEQIWVCIVGDGTRPENDEPIASVIEDDIGNAETESAQSEENTSVTSTVGQLSESPTQVDDEQEVDGTVSDLTETDEESACEAIIDPAEEFDFDGSVSDFCKNALSGGWAVNDNLMVGMIHKLLEEETLHIGEEDNDAPWIELSQAMLMAKSAASDSVNVRSKKLYEQLLLATNVGMDRHDYTGEKLIELFSEPSKRIQAIQLSAYCFAMFAPAHPYDFNLKGVVRAAEADYDSLFPTFSGIKPVYHCLTKIWDVIPEGFTSGILDILSDHAEGMAHLERIKKEASLLLDEPTVKTMISGLPDLLYSCFGIKSDMRTAIETVVANRRDDQDIVESLLLEYCSPTENGYEISDRTIDDVIDREWKKASKGKRTNHMTLGMLARDQIRQAFIDRLEILKTWVEYNANVDENRLPEIRKLAHQLSVSIDEAIPSLLKVDSTEKPALVLWMLLSISDHLNARIMRQRLFVDLFQTGIFSVDDEGMPIINPSFNLVAFYEPWRLAIEHIAMQREDLMTVALSIVEGQPPYGDNLHQLEMIGKYLNDRSDRFIISSQQMQEAQRSAEAETEEFKNRLEIAYTYNQVEETDKENLLAIIYNYQDLFFGIGDFGNWQRFISALDKQINQVAAKRKEGLHSALAACFETLKPGEQSSLLDEARRLLFEKENYAVTEEYINRFRNGERDISSELSSASHEPDSFSEFMSDAVFTPLYEECIRWKSMNFSKQSQAYFNDHFPPMWAQRQKDDSLKLLKNWPARQGAIGSSQIADLFRGLGLSVKNAEKLNSKRYEQYQLTVDKTDRNMPDYRHPISVFGTQAISPLNVVVLYGNIMAQELVDIMTGLNLGSMSIVLLNYPVSRDYRRDVAEIFHKGTIGHSSFLLIDQTLLLHLAFHQDTERLPVLLKCTLPFTAYQPFLRDGGPTADEMFCGRVEELSTIIDPNGASVVYGGRQLGKTALLERAESLTLKPDKKAYAVYCSIYEITTEAEVVEKILHDIRNRPYMSQFVFEDCETIQRLCDQFNGLMNNGQINSMLLLIDEADAFLHAISGNKYEQIRPMVELKRNTRNKFKFVLAGLHNVCRAKNATSDNGIFGQLGQPLCVKPLSPTDALQLISRPLRYLGYQVEMYPHLETILTNTNYYPGILQFFGYMLVQALPSQYGKYYRANQGNPPFFLEEKQLGEIMNSNDLNASIRDKFRWSLELDKRYFMLARIITMLYYENQNNPISERTGYSIDEIMQEADSCSIHCLENLSKVDYGNLLDEMVSMGILSCIVTDAKRYRLRRHSFINIIGSDIDKLLTDILEENEEVDA